MNEIIEKQKVENLIYEVREKQVMLDSDLANLYECTNGTKDINKAVKRNIERFPNDFYFQLTTEEYNSLRFQNGTLKEGRGQHRKYTPYVFTEQGVAMLASILKTKVAAEVSIRIMRTFVTMRHYINNNGQYNNLKVIYDSTFHDRYFIIDNEKIYHCGTSINRIGHKTFSINLIDDKEVTKPLINKIKKLIQNVSITLT